MKFYQYFFICFLVIQPVFSQEKAEKEHGHVLIADLLQSLEEVHAVRFSYEDGIITDKKIVVQDHILELESILWNIENDHPLRFQKIDEENYIILKTASSLKDIQQLEKVTLSTYLQNGIQKEGNAAYELNLKKMHTVPGLVENDILESIQQLPGVTSPDETATNLVVRGGTQDQNRVIWDGINSYHKGHLFGMISPFNPNIAPKVSFHNKGTDPKYGERVSSVINITTNDEIPDEIKASFNVNAINASVVVETPVIQDKLSVQASFRRSFTDYLESASSTNISRKVFQTTKIDDPNNRDNEFFFSDYNVKINYKPDENNGLHFSTFYITNNLDHLVEDTEMSKTFNDLLTVSSQGYSLKWDATLSENVSQNTLVSLSRYRFDYNFITNQGIDEISNFDKRNRILDSSLNTETVIRTNKTDRLSLGYQYNYKDVDFSFKETLDVLQVLDADETSVSTHSLYSGYKWQHKWFDFEGGIRMNYYANFDEVRIEPRFVVQKEILKNVTLQITGEAKNQIISQIDETIVSDLSLENQVWRLANNETYPIIHSEQFSAGLIYKNKGWYVDLDLYRKNIQGLTAMSLGFLNPESDLVHLGDQKVKGVDLYLKKNIKKFNLGMSYTFNDVKSRFNDINDTYYFNANGVVAHSGSLSFAYNANRLEMALGFRVQSGLPFTETIEQEDGTLTFKHINTGTLQPFHRMDISSTYRFAFNKKSKLRGKLGIAIRNLYDQKNQISRQYTGSNTINDPIKVVDKFSLGFTPNFLFKVYW